MANKLAFPLNRSDSSAVYNVVSPFGPGAGGVFNSGLTLGLGNPAMFSILAICAGKLSFEWQTAAGNYSLRLQPRERVNANLYESVSAFVVRGVTDINSSFLATMLDRFMRDTPKEYEKLRVSVGREPTSADYKNWILRAQVPFLEVLAGDICIPTAQPANQISLVIETSTTGRAYFGERNLQDPADFWRSALSRSSVADATTSQAQAFVAAVPKRAIIEIRDEHNAPITVPPGNAVSGNSPQSSEIVVKPAGAAQIAGTNLVRGAVAIDVTAEPATISLSANDGAGNPLNAVETGYLFSDFQTGLLGAATATIVAPSAAAHLVFQAIKPARWLAPQQATVAAGYSRLSRYTTGNSILPLIDGRAYFRDLYGELQLINRNIAGHHCYILAWWLDLKKTFLIPGNDQSNFESAVQHIANASPALVRLMVYDHPWWDIMHPGQEEAVWEAALTQLGADFVKDADGLPSSPSIALLRSEGDHHIKVVSIVNSNGTVAYCGGIDLNTNRMTDQEHPNASAMDYVANFMPKELHDIQLKVQGPAAVELERVFRNRWKNHPNAFPHSVAEPALPPAELELSGVAVQVACTIPSNQGYQFASQGDTTIYETIASAIRNAKQYVYIEDQYFANETIAHQLAARIPDLEFVILIGPGPYVFNELLLGRPLNELHAALYPIIWSAFHSQSDISFAQFTAILRGQLGAATKVRACYLSNRAGEFIFPHSKIIIVDDVFVSCGSANIDARGMGNILKADGSTEHASSTECNLMCLDTALSGGGRRKLAKEFRSKLWAEHLNLPYEELVSMDAASIFEKYWTTQRGRVRFYA